MMFEFFTPGCRDLRRSRRRFHPLRHGAWGVGFETLKAQFAFCRGLDLVPLVRVPSGALSSDRAAARHRRDGHHGADGRDERAGAADRRLRRYPPAGVRGSASMCAHDDYAGGDVDRENAHANERTLVIALVETARGIANIDAIMAVDGHRCRLARPFRPDRQHGNSGTVRAPGFSARSRFADRRLPAQRQAGAVFWPARS